MLDTLEGTERIDPRDDKLRADPTLHCIVHGELPSLLNAAVEQGFDFIAAPLFHPRFQRDDAGVSDARTSAPTLISVDRWSSCVVGKLSPWLSCDSPCAHIRASSARALKQEVAWASHLGVPAVMTTAPLTHDAVNLAMLLNQTVQSGSGVHFWVSVGTHAEDAVEAEAEGKDGDAPPAAYDARRDPWEAWRTLRGLVDMHPQVSAVLVLSSRVPPPAVTARWLAEPVKAAVLPTSIFILNKHGYPTLSRGHQELLHKLHAYKVQFLVRGRPLQRDPSAASGEMPSYRLYLQYLAHVLSKTPPMTEKDRFEAPFYDVLQAPLQPLMDNLESQTYDVFERDPVKYTQYEAAALAALRRTPEEQVTVVMVVGAGRGPLVHRVLAAAAAAARRVRVYAVEKNPNAVITLRNLVRTMWGDQVTVVASDMRVWKAPEQADILVSELLGSFGDNELSPECLDGMQPFLKPGGISIPSSYTSFAAPVMSSKLWNEVNAYKEPKWFETPYVVRMVSAVQLAPPQPCFTFRHPNPEARIDNRRFVSLKFTATMAGVVHGVAGYFDATLFEDVRISINPETHSPGMFSWFPLYIPLKSPCYVEEGQAIEFHMWRCVSSTKVWYEWAVTQPAVSGIHNPGGRSYYIGL